MLTHIAGSLIFLYLPDFFSSFMKTFLLKQALSLLVLMAWQATELSAQSCYSYFPMRENTHLSLTSYTPKGKPTSVAHYTVKEFAETAAGYEANIHMLLEDEKGKELSQNTFTATCANGVYTMDMSVMLDQNSLQSIENMNMTISGDELTLPAELRVGESLPDAEMLMKAEGPMSMRATFKIVNRKVVGQESITTPAGTFECFVITADQSFKMMMNMESTTKQWLAPEVGMVRSEFYNKNGKLSGYTELTKLDN
jgi:hypothetical protein